MQVGITGASGFLGSAIIEEGKRRGWKVIAFSRRPDRQVPGADEVRSLADSGSVDLGGIDALVHLAGEPIAALWTRDRKRRIHESRVDLTRDLVEAMEGINRVHRPSVFVSASAIGYYGNRGDDLLEEDSDPGFGFLPMVCRDWETASAGATRLGVRLVNPRIGLVLGRSGFLGRLRPLFRLGLGGKIGSGRQWMSWIHVRDLARIFAECVENPSIHGAVNTVAPRPATNREFTTVYARVLGRVAWFPVPAFVLKRLPGGMGRIFLDSQRVEPTVMKAFGFEWRYPDLESALRAVENGEPAEV
ncbi:MAG: TIGR01777 family oxidoreductase [Verrucomicrobiae bacterium]|nr:TIGR01777 family oxidoreductase [Verrucomicrobiae bacterium]